MKMVLPMREFIFRENNANGRVEADTIDLHGQFVEEAEEILEVQDLLGLLDELTVQIDGVGLDAPVGVVLAEDELRRLSVVAWAEPSSCVSGRVQTWENSMRWIKRA
jgi:hypothetical protein